MHLPHMAPLAYDIPHPSAPLSPDAYQCTMSPSLCTYMLYVPYIMSVKQAPQPTTIILASASHTSSRCHSPHRTHATLSFTQHLPKPHPQSAPPCHLDVASPNPNPKSTLTVTPPASQGSSPAPVVPPSMLLHYITVSRPYLALPRHPL